MSATAPLVETSEGRVSSVIEESQVRDLPLLGRNFFNLVVLTPGVTGRAAGGGQAYAQSNADIFINEYGVNMNANGARTESNNFLVDSSTDRTSGGMAPFATMARRVCAVAASCIGGPPGLNRPN